MARRQLQEGVRRKAGGRRAIGRSGRSQIDPSFLPEAFLPEAFLRMPSCTCSPAEGRP